MSAKEVDNVPNFLSPRLRLFLSIDLVGSTALKQGGLLTLNVTDSDAESRVIGATWVGDLVSFYREFDRSFTENWISHSEKAKNCQWDVRDQPELWKINGDELIYVKEVFSANECILSLMCWLKTANEYRTKLRTKKKLDVKLSAWTAGFPLMNTEIIFRSTSSRLIREHVYPFPELVHFQELEMWYNFPKDKRVGWVRDYLGPSIDNGFRVAEKATPRKFTISIELAYIISTIKDVEVFDELYIGFDGPQTLKGVLGGKPYPIFWIDAERENKVFQNEDRLLNRRNSRVNEIYDYCKSFIQDNSSYIFIPFISTETDPLLNRRPAWYGLKLQELANEYRKMKIAIEEQDKAFGGDNLPPNSEDAQDIDAPLAENTSVNVLDPGRDADLN